MKKQALSLKKNKKTLSFFDLDRYDHLFFDFDGVILDSEDIKTKGFVKMYERYGKPIMDKVIKHHVSKGGIGMSRFEKFRLYHKKFLKLDLTDNDIRKLAKEFSDIVLRKVLKSRYIQGALRFLKMCKSHRKDCFVISATPEWEIKKIIRLKGLKRYFKEVKGSPQSKVKNIKDLINKYGVDKKRAVLFGDSINDKRAARLNNIGFVGINYFGTRFSCRNFNELFS